MLGNAAFCIGIAVLIAVSKSNPLTSPRGIFIAPFAFLLTAMILAIAGMAMFEWSRLAGVALMSPLALGYAPTRGPDAPFFVGIPRWLLTNFLLICIGIALGAALRRGREEPNVTGGECGAGSR